MDTILHGGLFRGASYLIAGDPGNGKTIFASQLAFQVIASGGRVVYVTLLTETHDQLIAQLRPLTFFDPEALGQAMLYLSGTQTLLQKGMDGLRRLLRDAVRDHQATLVIIDRLTPAETLSSSALSRPIYYWPFRAFGDRVAGSWYNMGVCYHSLPCLSSCSHAPLASRWARWH